MTKPDWDALEAELCVSKGCHECDPQHRLIVLGRSETARADREQARAEKAEKSDDYWMARTREWQEQGERMRERIASLEQQLAARTHEPFQIRFDGPPSHESGRFVEVEDLATGMHGVCGKAVSQCPARRATPETLISNASVRENSLSSYAMASERARVVLILFKWATSEWEYLLLLAQAWLPVGVHPVYEGRSVLMRKG